MPTLDYFIQSLMHEQDKLIKMGTLKNSKAHAVTVHVKGKENSQDIRKEKGRRILIQERDEIPNPLMDHLAQRKGKERKGNQCGIIATVVFILNLHA